jgi:hypothetical protein
MFTGAFKEASSNTAHLPKDNLFSSSLLAD